MKKQRPNGHQTQNIRKQKQRQRQNRDEHLNELLKMCLERVCQLQAELENTNETDAEAAGYTACTIETLQFLSNEGLAPNHPIVQRLTERLTREKDD